MGISGYRSYHKLVNDMIKNFNDNTCNTKDVSKPMYKTYHVSADFIFKAANLQDAYCELCDYFSILAEDEELSCNIITDDGGYCDVEEVKSDDIIERDDINYGIKQKFSEDD